MRKTTAIILSAALLFASVLFSGCSEAEMSEVNWADGREGEKQRIYSAYLTGQMERTDAEKALAELGVQIIDSAVGEDGSASFPSQLDCTDVTVFHDTEDGTWEVGAGVWWTDGSWQNEVGAWLGKKQLGSFDSVGIVLYDHSGSFDSCRLVDTWLYAADENGEMATVSHSPSGPLDSKYGVLHQYADYALGGSYYGAHVAVVAKYSEDFANFHGKAKLQYCHTWDEVGLSFSETEIDKSFGITVGFDLRITNEEDCIDVLSPRYTEY